MCVYVRVHAHVCMYVCVIVLLLAGVFNTSGQLGDVISGLSYTPNEGKMNGVGGARVINISSISGQNEREKKQRK